MRYFLAFVVAGGALGVAWLVARDISHQSAAQSQFEVLNRVRNERPAEYKKALRDTVKAFSGSKNPKDQDLVAAAHMRLAYLSSAKQDFVDARKEMLDAAQTKGSGTSNPDYGTAQDQARYQAIVCLVAQGKKEAAREEFVQFIKSNPTSPMAIQCYRRLVRLNGGVARPEDDELMQWASNKRQLKLQQSLAKCGPVVVQRMLKLAARPVPSTDELISECNTAADGSSLAAVQSSLATRGIALTGYEVNRADFSRLVLPAIWLTESHFVVVERIAEDSAEVFDPMVMSVTKITIPGPDNKDFSAVVLASKISGIAGSNK